MERLICLAVQKYCKNQGMTYRETETAIEINTAGQNYKFGRWAKKNNLTPEYTGGDNYRIPFDDMAKYGLF